MRLIDADALFDEITTHKDKSDMPELWYEGVDFAKWFIFNATTIDPVRHALWVSDRSLGGHCSNCGIECGSVEWGDDYLIKPTWNYCPNCGAKMDGGE